MPCDTPAAPLAGNMELLCAWIEARMACRLIRNGELVMSDSTADERLEKLGGSRWT